MITSLLLLSNVAFSQELEPTLLTQVWVTAFDQDVNSQADPAGYGDPEDDQGFKLRRARAGFVGNEGDFSYGLVLGMSSSTDGLAQSDGTVGIVDAYAGWQLHQYFQLTAGVQKVPFGREQLLSSGELVFQERAVTSNHIAPGRELGLLASSGAYGADIQIGLFNGNGSIVGDDNDGLMYAARVGYTLGDGPSDRTYGVVSSPVVSIGTNLFYDQGTATDTMAYGADLLFRWKGLALLTEVHLASITPKDSTVDVPEVFAGTDRQGALVQAGWTLGIFEPAVRAEIFDDDKSAEDNGDILKIVAGLTAHFSEDRVRAGMAYVHRTEMGGQSLANDTARLFFQMRR
jgi:hypothetical protein